VNRPQRFLHITTFYPPYSFGGDGAYVHRLAHALANAGHEVAVVHCVDSYDILHPGPPDIEWPDHPRVKVHPLRSRLRWLAPLVSHQSGRPLLQRAAITRVLDSAPFDVIHFHNISLLGPDVLAVGPSAGSPLGPAGPPLKIYTTHEHWLVCPTHVLWKFGKRPCDRPECLRCTLLAARPPQLWRYTRLLARAAENVDLFLAPSRFTAEMHAQRGFSAPFAVLPLFVERADEDWMSPPPPPHDRPYFLFVGRLERIKGIDTLLDAFGRAPVADLLIVGDGTEAARLKTLASGLPHVKFLGPQPQRELGRFYVHALACCVPSLTYEPFPTVVIEAFARKTPVVAHNLGGLTEIIEESGGGMLYHNTDELLKAVHDLTANATHRRMLGENGYRMFVDRWTREAHLERYFDLLDTARTRRARAHAC
jgi:glycosyltransferase involved in cell wall biosynthesis